MVTLLLSICLGLTLAAAAGFRAFLPLFILGLLQRFELLAPFSLGDNFAWLSTTSGLACLGTATLVEVIADKVPAVDSSLDTVMTFIRPAAGGISVIAVLSSQDPMMAYIGGIVLGGGATLPIHLGKGALRLGSHLTTAGFATPVISVAEDAASGGAVVGAALLPALAVALGLLALVLVFFLFRVWRRRRRQKKLNASTAE